MQPDRNADAHRVGMRYLLLALTGAALALGLFARFKGLGTWPLAIDEYYIARSVQNVLSFGIPEYECGGYYTRGLIFQYGVALLRLGELSPELAPRLIAALASLTALPAVYLLGRRIHGPTVGLLAIALLAVSLWEVEMARFGRMYAPFQAVFVWYLVFFLRYTVDREKKALWGMLALSVLGVLTWEGGIFLAATNLLPVVLRNADGRLRRDDWPYLSIALGLLIPVAWFVTADLRHAGPEPDLPLDYVEATGSPDTALAPWSTLTQHPGWAVALLPVLAIGLYALRWVWTFRWRWFLALGLLGALGAALVHQFAAFATLLLLLLLTDLIRWKELFSRPAVPYHLAIVASAAFWTAFGFATSDWYVHAQEDWLDGSRPLLLLYEFLRFPDLVRDILVPWMRAAPTLSLGLALLLGSAIARVIARGEASAERVLLVLLVFLGAAAAASDAPRHETRYVFFLFPLAILIAIAAIMRAVERLAQHRQWSPAAGVLAVLVLFMLSEDFRPHHLLTVDSAEANFRYGLSRGEISHLHPRSDLRGAAEWLTRHTTPARDMVVNAFPGVDFYYRDFDYAYIDRSNQRFTAYACHRGTIERWGNLPLLDSVSAIESQLAHGERSFVVTDTRSAEELLDRLKHWRPRVVWTSMEGHVNVIVFARNPDTIPLTSGARGSHTPGTPGSSAHVGMRLAAQ